MEQSPLELYETAYKYHYIDNRISDALLYYQKLIETFPDSNECGYASIQIQKIKAENLARELKKAGKILHPISMIAFILGLLSLLLSGTYGYLLSKKINLESQRSSLAQNAIGKMYRGEDDEALKVLTELKIVSSKQITPFELTADIFKKRKNYKAAREEYALFFKLNPEIQPSVSEIQTMQGLDQLISPIKNNSAVGNKVGSELNNNKKISGVLHGSQKKSVNIRKKKNSPIVKSDSISYF